MLYPLIISTIFASVFYINYNESKRFFAIADTNVMSPMDLVPGEDLCYNHFGFNGEIKIWTMFRTDKTGNLEVVRFNSPRGDHWPDGVYTYENSGFTYVDDDTPCGGPKIKPLIQKRNRSQSSPDAKNATTSNQLNGCNYSVVNNLGENCQAIIVCGNWTNAPITFDIEQSKCFTSAPFDKVTLAVSIPHDDKLKVVTISAPDGTMFPPGDYQLDNEHGFEPLHPK